MPVSELRTPPVAESIAAPALPTTRTRYDHPDCAPLPRAVVPAMVRASNRTTEIFGTPRPTRRDAAVRGLLTAALLAIGMAVAVPSVMGFEPTGSHPVIVFGVQAASTTTPTDSSGAASNAAAAQAIQPVALGTTAGSPGNAVPPVAPHVNAAAPPAAGHSTTSGAAPGAHAGAAQAPVATVSCAPGDYRLTLTVRPATAAGTVTVDGTLTNVSGHNCTSYGDDWRVDFSDRGTPPKALDGTGGGAATSTGAVVVAGSSKSANWSWDQHDCHVNPCAQVGPGKYRASVTWNGATSAVDFVLNG